MITIDSNIRAKQESEARAHAERRTTEQRMVAIEQKLDTLIALMNKKVK